MMERERERMEGTRLLPVHQINIDDVPDLANIFDLFDSQCRYPTNAEKFKLNLAGVRNAKRIGEMREDCERVPDRKKYRAIEIERKRNQKKEKKRSQMKEGMHVQPCDADHFRMSIVLSREKRETYEKRMEELRKRYDARYWLPRGHYFYPANRGFCSWHTNEYDTPGWRLYFIKVSSREDETRTPTNKKESSSFTYLEPRTGKRIRVWDKNRTAMLFKIPSREDALPPLWHNVHSGSYDRWSFGFALDEALAIGILNEAIKNASS